MRKKGVLKSICFFWSFSSFSTFFIVEWFSMFALYKKPVLARISEAKSISCCCWCCYVICFLRVPFFGGWAPFSLSCWATNLPPTPTTAPITVRAHTDTQRHTHASAICTCTLHLHSHV
jgi:hypothetical protein